MGKQVLSFGEVLWDAFGEEKMAGGAPMNVARHLVQQGVDTLFASRIGTDASGYDLAGFLKNNGLYSDLIQHDKELPTCEVTVQLDDHGHATYIIPQPVSWDNIKADDKLLDAAKATDVIVFGSLAARDKTTRDTLHTLLDESDAIKVFDVNLRAPHYELSTLELFAAKADIIKMNEDEANLLIGSSNGDALQTKIIEFQKTYHNDTIVITRGGDGAIVWHDEKLYEHAGVPVNAVDTVGAGDSFLATFIAGLLDERPIPEILDRACKVGAYVATQRGANPVYPEGLL
ncbi:carbohydrate kinase family protein [Mucilaginibacter myungsuensis]|uniref:Carbohydrate kinase n=1 Tax=Mucilaginibacter myungsuensis TaxID=649104 RepID=A0A929PY96_9SPHI|nr:carbohydrate kinase [Mucilaginibacter myungsuensis]MBE9663949.1 carbohydrate kinase [Mucilaginibacter myungsuensis]MDN3598335.1 carbohydrate kinase [Mucilaginibacter myungsuensis]